MAKNHTGGTTGNTTQSTNNHNDWKNRPPYSHPTSTNLFPVRWTGSCHCTRVQYQLSRPKPLDAKFCHCTTCQRLHGAPFQWAAIFQKDDINFVSGVEDLVWYDSGRKSVEHKLPCKVTCGYCRTPVMDEGRNMILLFPTLVDFERGGDGASEGRKAFEPSCHMFYGQRVVDVRDGKPKWTGLNEESELMDDDGNVVKGEKRKRDEEEKGNGQENGKM